ncbi:MAG: glycosyltransferase family 2 protein [Candidatus Delongbacteria bacterium]|nr:glycosyltransferase family 2 protein [Candidatus Delongbacteria bacterium]
MSSLTVIIPVYNEENAIEATLSGLIPYAEKNNWRIVVINDGSTDKTGEILAKIEGIRVITHPINKGYGAALKTGIILSDTRWVAFYDSDGQHNPEDLEQLMNNIRNFDMLVGERGKDSHQEWLRKPGKWILSKTANFLTERTIPDLNSGLRIIRRGIILNILHLMPDGFSFTTTSTVAFINLGFNVGYRSIRVNKRIGNSTVKQFKHGSNTILLIIRLILLFNPLKVFMPVSFFVFAAGALYEILYGIIWTPDHIRLILGALLAFVTSALIFFMGLVVDQLSSLRKNLHFEKLLKEMMYHDPTEGNK